MAAGLLARKARQAGLRVPSWVKTSLGPGSPAAADYLARAGLLDDLAAVGFDIVGYGRHGGWRHPPGGRAVGPP
ncbi:hypothetical protein G6F32_017097 [Rhizopus arrhizus]|nr:hypothetical protein G6F32_017097 [Rhizopus arrhizus]